jgi:hypothetical protein
MSPIVGGDYSWSINEAITCIAGLDGKIEKEKETSDKTWGEGEEREKNVMGQVNEPDKAGLGLNINKSLEAWLSRGLTDLGREALLSIFLFIYYHHHHHHYFFLIKFLIFILLK